MSNFHKGLSILCVLVSGLLCQQTTAQDNINWTGAVNNDWNNAGNWNRSGITSIAPITFNATTPVFTITLFTANTEIAIGDSIEGFGIAPGAKITAIDGTSKIITMDLATVAAVGLATATSPVVPSGTNITFTFATPKMALSPPTLSDIAVISNGGNPTLPVDFITVAGLIIGNKTGAITGSTLTIPMDANLTVDCASNEPVLVRGGNIVNNGTLNIINSLGLNVNAVGTGAYGMTFGLPSQIPTTPTTYTYSGSGTLKIDTAAGNNFSGGILFNGIHANAANTTYRLLFDGPTTFTLSDKKATNGGATTQFIRVVGSGNARTCNIALGGKGFDLGDSVSGGLNGLLSASGGAINVTIESGTTFNVYSNANNGSNGLALYAFGNSLVPTKVVNKGTLNFIGTSSRHTISMITQNPTVILELENQGTITVNADYTVAAQTSLFIGSFASNPTTVLAPNNKCFFTNSGTFSITQKLNGVNAGNPIIAQTNGTINPAFDLINTGTINIDAAGFIVGTQAFDPLKPENKGTNWTNSGTINTNQEIRNTYIVNNEGATVKFTGNTNHPNKLFTFGVLIGAAATAGTTYTDSNGLVYTVVLNKVAATGTSLVTQVNSNIVNPRTIVADPADPTIIPSTLTKTGTGAGDSSIVFTVPNPIQSTNDNALFNSAANSGTIITNTGSRLLTGLSGFRPTATSILSPGGNTGTGVVNFADRTDNSYTLLGTIKLTVKGNTTAGVDYDKLVYAGKADSVDISAATLDVTGIYTPTAATTIDILTTYETLVVGEEGAVVNGGPFGNVVGLTPGWSVNYTGVFNGKVQLVYDPNNLGTVAFESFNFSVYPNPTAGAVNISAAKNISTVAFYNLLGQKVKAFTVNAKQQQLDISSLQKGVYVMEATIDNAKKSFKIVKD